MTTKTKSNVAKSAKKSSFKFRWWYALIAVAIIAVVGVVVVRLSHASTSPVPTQTLSLPTIPVIGGAYSFQTANNPYKNVTVANINGRGTSTSCVIYQNYKNVSNLNACLVQNGANMLQISSEQFVNFKNNKQLRICAFVQKPADSNSHLTMQLTGFTPLSPEYSFTTKSDTYGCFNNGNPIPAIQFKNIDILLQNNNDQYATYPLASIIIDPVQ